MDDVSDSQLLLGGIAARGGEGIRACGSACVAPAACTLPCAGGRSGTDMVSEISCVVEMSRVVAVRTEGVRFGGVGRGPGDGQCGGREKLLESPGRPDCIGIRAGWGITSTAAGGGLIGAWAGGVGCVEWDGEAVGESGSGGGCSGCT